MSEALNPQAIRQRLATSIGPRHAAGFELRVVAETGSTNDDALRMAENGAPDGTVVFAESQTAGRGRRGDAWVSPSGTNLLFSILLRPSAPIGSWTRIPHLAGLAVCRALEHVFPDLPTPMLKWPNDVYLTDRKLAGILVESRSWKGEPPVAVLGIGLNVNLLPDQFPEELRSIATTLRAHTGQLMDRNELAAAILAEWAVVYPSALTGNFSRVREELQTRSWLMGKNLTVLSGNREISGQVVEVGPEGELILQRQNGDRETILSADRVSW